MVAHAEHCVEHGQRCPDCRGSLTCEGCRTHGGTYLWELRCESCSKRTHYETYRYLLEPAVQRPNYERVSHTFTTPRGNTATMFYRQDTNDWNTIFASMTEDEYGLRSLPPLSGFAVDIGAHIGSVGIGLAIDNPGLKVICVEPVPDNISILRANIAINNVEDRMTLIDAAAGGPDDKETVVDWGYVGEPHLEHHAFIGNTALVYEFGSNPTFEHREQVAECFSLSRLMRLGGIERLALLKIDCEGCEWRVLTDSAVDCIDVILGEWHNVPLRGQRGNRDSVLSLLPNHNVVFSGPVHGPGGFFAVHK